MVSWLLSTDMCPWDGVVIVVNRQVSVRWCGLASWWSSTGESPTSRWRTFIDTSLRHPTASPGTHMTCREIFKQLYHLYIDIMSYSLPCSWCFEKTFARMEHEICSICTRVSAVLCYQLVQWRSGILSECVCCRMYPGSELPQSYDAPQQVWYIRARAAYPALTFTGPHQSEFTGQRVVTIARALKAGDR